jgi:hypothetical protein
VWHKASTVDIKRGDPDSEGPVYLNEVDIYSTVMESGLLNKNAARVTALAVGLQALANLAPKIVSVARVALGL